MGTKEPFGGLSIITVDDLFQLKPVFDYWIFENTHQGYSTLAGNVKSGKNIENVYITFIR